MTVCAAHYCAFPSIFQILPKTISVCRTCFPPRQELELADLWFKCQGCFTFAFQIPFAFIFNPFLGLPLKQQCVREALVLPGVVAFYSCWVNAWTRGSSRSFPTNVILCVYRSCEVDHSAQAEFLDDQMNL